jgi:superfamily I DNA/RNA helicase
MKRIDVVNIDTWVSNFLQKHDYNYNILYHEQGLDDFWDKAYNLAPENPDLPKEFYREEWSAVIQNNGISDLSDYMRVSRIGRGRRLTRGERKKIWQVFEEYRSLLNAENKKEFVDAARDARAILSSKGNILPYKAVIIDEAQDMSPEVFRLIRQIIPENPDKNNNDIFIVGDAHQRIYEHRIVLSHCGINIRGRGRKLKINYRTTDETRKWAESILVNCNIDDLDGGLDSNESYKSITHGSAPIIKNFQSFSDEVQFLKNELISLQKAGVNLNSVCLVARTHKLLNQYQGALNASGIEVYEIKHKVADKTQTPGLRIATMHRVKGIEFDYIFIAGTNDGIIPSPSDLDDNETSRIDHETKERALLYVAATRARKGVFITGFGAVSKFIDSAC